MSDHKLKIEFGDGQFWTTLIHPKDGCLPAFDAIDGGDECWLIGWDEGLELKECVSGEVTVDVTTDWDGDLPVVRIVPPSPKTEGKPDA